MNSKDVFIKGKKRYVLEIVLGCYEVTVCLELWELCPTLENFFFLPKYLYFSHFWFILLNYNHFFSCPVFLSLWNFFVSFWELLWYVWVYFLQFFTTKPLPCDPSSLPKYPPSKEFDTKVRDEEARRCIFQF